MPQATRVFLIGLPLSGKTSVAKTLAKTLRWPCFDLDSIIENTTGKSIATLFAEKGTQGFRDLESDCLQSLLLRPPPLVLATGGGTPCFKDQMEVLKRAGVTIFLDLSWQEMYTRLSPAHQQKRPLLKKALSAQALEKTFAQRMPIYAKAALTLSAHLSPATLVQRIGKFLA